MELLKRQLLSPRYIQHSARVLFVVGQAGGAERAADPGGDLRSFTRGNREAVEAGKHEPAARWPLTTTCTTFAGDKRGHSSASHEIVHGAAINDGCEFFGTS